MGDPQKPDTFGAARRYVRRKTPNSCLENLCSEIFSINSEANMTAKVGVHNTAMSPVEASRAWMQVSVHYPGIVRETGMHYT